MTGFLQNTKVIIDNNGNYKYIQDLRVGDQVLSYDVDTQIFKSQEVVDITTVDCNEVVKYTFSNDVILYGCEHLIFLTSDGYKENIQIGDEVITTSGLATLVKEELLESAETLYELDIEEIDNYCVNGIVVHNAMFTFWIYNNSGISTLKSWNKSNTTGVLVNISANGDVTPTGYATYTPSGSVKGYAKSANSSTITYALGTTTTWSRGLNFYEIPNSSSGYTITYHTNNGTSVPSASGVTKLPNPLPTTTKTKYKFWAWYIGTSTSCDYTTQAVPGRTITANTHLWAQWEFAHTQYANNGLAKSHVREYIRIKQGTPTKLRFTSADVSMKEGRVIRDYAFNVTNPNEAIECNVHVEGILYTSTADYAINYTGWIDAGSSNSFSFADMCEADPDSELYGLEECYVSLAPLDSDTDYFSESESFMFER